MSQKILITGATGNFGKATIDFLLKKGVTPNSISSLTKAEIEFGVTPIKKRSYAKLDFGFGKRRDKSNRF